MLYARARLLSLFVIAGRRFTLSRCQLAQSFRSCAATPEMSLNVQTVALTSAFTDQEPGTSGLRKPVKVFTQPNYTESFVQSILTSLGPELKGSTIILGGDGRYFVKRATEIILQMCAAHQVGRVLVGQNGILSTPAASHLIRKNKALCGILLTASHNPGGPDNDFGIKCNSSNGGPAPTSVTSAIFEISKQLKEYKIVPGLSCPLDSVTTTPLTYKIADWEMKVEVIDPVKDYVDLMKDIFDFDALKKLLSGSSSGKPFKILIDSMHGVTGPYARKIFEEELGAAPGSVVNGEPLEDFGGGHPDPNLIYAAELVSRLKKNEHDFGAAFDGDGDRNMVLGRGAFFVTPSDSLAVIAAHLSCIPYFKKNQVKGFARSMPTAGAVDRVGQELGLPVYETPTGWKFFGNLLDSDKVSLCGEESFGTGSNHIREKDGIWAVLAWLSVVEHLKQPVEEILCSHWNKFGRNYALRYDYESVDSAGAKNMMAELEKKITSPSFKGTVLGNYTVDFCDNFAYIDPADKSVSRNQGLRVVMTDGSRIVYRLSGTGSQGATIRVYLEVYTKTDVKAERDVVFDVLGKQAVHLADIQRFTNRDRPTVIT